MSETKIKDTFILLYPDFSAFETAMNGFTPNTVAKTDEVFYTYIKKRFADYKFLYETEEVNDTKIFSAFSHFKNVWVKVLSEQKKTIKDLIVAETNTDNYGGDLDEVAENAEKFLQTGASNTFTPAIISIISSITNLPNIFAKLEVLMAPVFQTVGEIDDEYSDPLLDQFIRDQYRGPQGPQGPEGPQGPKGDKGDSGGGGGGGGMTPAEKAQLNTATNTNNNQDLKISQIEQKNTSQDTKITGNESKINTQAVKLANIELKNTQQDSAIATKADTTKLTTEIATTMKWRDWTYNNKIRKDKLPDGIGSGTFKNGNPTTDMDWRNEIIQGGLTESWLRDTLGKKQMGMTKNGFEFKTTIVATEQGIDAKQVQLSEKAKFDNEAIRNDTYKDNNLALNKLIKANTDGLVKKADAPFVIKQTSANITANKFWHLLTEFTDNTLLECYLTGANLNLEIKTYFIDLLTNKSFNDGIIAKTEWPFFNFYFMLKNNKKYLYFIANKECELRITYNHKNDNPPTSENWETEAQASVGETEGDEYLGGASAGSWAKSMITTGGGGSTLPEYLKVGEWTGDIHLVNQQAILPFDISKCNLFVVSHILDNNPNAYTYEHVYGAFGSSQNRISSYNTTYDLEFSFNKTTKVVKITKNPKVPTINSSIRKIVGYQLKSAKGDKGDKGDPGQDGNVSINQLTSETTLLGGERVKNLRITKVGNQFDYSSPDGSAKFEVENDGSYLLTYNGNTLMNIAPSVVSIDKTKKPVLGEKLSNDITLTFDDGTTETIKGVENW